jgi:hypothetical protein
MVPKRSPKEAEDILSGSVKVIPDATGVAKFALQINAISSRHGNRFFVVRCTIGDVFVDTPPIEVGSRKGIKSCRNKTPYIKQENAACYSIPTSVCSRNRNMTVRIPRIPISYSKVDRTPMTLFEGSPATKQTMQLERKQDIDPLIRPFTFMPQFVVPKPPICNKTAQTQSLYFPIANPLSDTFLMISTPCYPSIKLETEELNFYDDGPFEDLANSPIRMNNEDGGEATYFSEFLESIDFDETK